MYIYTRLTHSGTYRKCTSCRIEWCRSNKIGVPGLKTSPRSFLCMHIRLNLCIYIDIDFLIFAHDETSQISLRKCVNKI